MGRPGWQLVCWRCRPLGLAGAGGVAGAGGQRDGGGTVYEVSIPYIHNLSEMKNRSES